MTLPAPAPASVSTDFTRLGWLLIRINCSISDSSLYIALCIYATSVISECPIPRIGERLPYKQTAGITPNGLSIVSTSLASSPITS